MAGRQTRRQLQFTGFEMAVLGVSFVVTVSAVFFLGLFVGKRNAWHHAPAEDRVARVPVDDFTRYKRPAPIPAAPKAAEVASAAPAPAAPKSAEKAAEAEPVAKAPAAAAPASAPATPPTVPDAQADAAVKAGDDAKEAEAKKLAEAKKAADAKKKEEAEKAEASSGGGYTVQLLSTRKEADADALVRKLKARGYAAYIRKTADGAGGWYRVRVGSYGSFSDARAMADKCRADLGLAQAFVSTE